MHLKLLQKESFKKAEEATGDLIGHEIANRIIKNSKNSQQNISETVTNVHDKEMPKERHLSREKRQEIIDEIRLKKYQEIIIQRQLQITKEKYISPEKRQTNIDNLRWIVIV